MPEQLQKILDRIIEWWKKFNTKQKTLLVSIAAVIILALVILAVVVTKPEMQLLYQCESLSEAAEIQDLLEDQGISFEVSSDGLEFTVDKDDLAAAKILLGSNGIPTTMPSIDDVFTDGFSATEADKAKRYKLYLANDLAAILEEMPAVESASVRLDLPSESGTILSKDEQAYVGVMLTLKEELEEEQAEAIAKFVATQVGNDDTSNITIIDSFANVLFSGDDETSVTGTASSQMKLQAKSESLIKEKIKGVLVGSSVFDHAEIAVNLDMDFDEQTEVVTEYYAPDGQTNGMISQQSVYEAETQGGTAGVPGTDSNDDTTYVIEDGEITVSTVSDMSTTYQNNVKQTTYVKSVGSIDSTTSSISVIVSKYVIYNEDVLRASGALEDMTFEEYIMANSEPVKQAVDEEYYELVSNATGFSTDNITIISYTEPIFEYSSGTERSLSDYLQIILAVLIFVLLGVVVFLSTRKEKSEEPEEELSVESLLESTKESQDSLEDIGYNEKSETWVLIDKFVEENPEAAASLLRNWLNDDWE